MVEFVFPLLAMVSFGISPLFYKAAIGRGIYPITSNGIRALMVLPMMLIFFLPSLGDLFNVNSYLLILLALIAFFGPVMGDTLYFFSLRYIDVSLTAPISSAYSLLIPVWMILFFHSYPPATVFLGAILVISGIYAIQERKLGIMHKKGVVFAFLSAIFYSLAIVLMGMVIPTASVVSITIYRIIFSIMFLVPFSFRNGNFPMDPKIWIILGIGGFFGIGVGIVFMLYGIQTTGVTITGIFSSASPLITSALGILLFKERSDLKKISGICMIGTGLIISSL